MRCWLTNNSRTLRSVISAAPAVPRRSATHALWPAWRGAGSRSVRPMATTTHGADAMSSDGEPEAVHGEDDGPQSVLAAKYRGVRKLASGRYSARISVSGEVKNLGTFDLAILAAQAYDKAARESHGEHAKLNFPEVDSADLVAAWKPPKAPPKPVGIPVIRGQTLTKDEIVSALESEGAENVVTLDISKHSDLAKYFIICTGKTPAHMRRMADMIVSAVRARRLKKRHSVGVEDRDANDWMLVDLNSIVVHFFDADARRIYDLETLWTRDTPEGLRQRGVVIKSHDDFVDAFPLPDDVHVLDALDAAEEKRGRVVTVDNEEEQWQGLHYDDPARRVMERRKQMRPPGKHPKERKGRKE